jgi:hypothetical protein
MQKSTLFAIIILAALLMSAVLTVATAQTASGEDQTEKAEDKTLTGMAIGIGSAIFTVGLIGVVYFRKQE